MTRADVRESGLEELNRLRCWEPLGTPPVRYERGRQVRADGGEWDPWYALPAHDRTHIRKFMSGPLGLEPDVAAGRLGMTVPEWWEAFIRASRAARVGRGRQVDAMDEWDEPDEPDELRSLEYALDLAGPDLLDLVAAGDVAQRAGVTVSAVRKWRARYSDFPAPLAVVGAGRRAPRGEAAGTPVWAWAQVARWLETTGRRSTR